jgi:uncharacterized protein (DUF1684 family)
VLNRIRHSGGARRARHRRLAAALLLAVSSLACGGAPATYTEEIAQHRARVNEFMRDSSESPIPPDKRTSLLPLPYYPIDEEYRVPASLRLLPADQIIQLSTSTGVPRRMRRIGSLAFTVKGQPLTLTAFADVDDQQLRRLFVPFGDLTSGAETYPGGRYLDLDRTGSNVYDLDFNRAYHPYCVFDAKYECPVPPRENRLTIPIRAGEKLP